MSSRSSIQLDDPIAAAVVALLRPVLAELLEEAGTTVAPAYFSLRDASRYLGISRYTFMRLRARGLIEEFHLPGVHDARFKRKDLDHLIRSGTRPVQS